MKTIMLGKLGDLKLSAKPNTLIGLILLWIILALLGWAFLHLPIPAALIGGLIAALIHFASEIIHQLGHAAAARRTGHPMKGMRFWWILAQSLYPSDEGDLPPATHIQRALGGPFISLIVATVAGVIALLLAPLNELTFYRLAYYLVAFAFVDNLFFFFIGSLLPLGFTDGSTLLRYWGKVKVPSKQ